MTAITTTRRRRFLHWCRDAGERAAKTFTQVFLAQVAADGLDIIPAVQDSSSLQRAALAGIGAVLSLVTSALSRWAGSPATASLVD